MWPWWVKIPTEDFTDETLTINDTYGGDVREFVVLVMEVDKVADEVTNTEVEKVTNMMAEFAANTSYLAAKFLTNESGATWWPNFQLMELAPPGGQIFN